jgi:hypothetical protein
MSRTKRLLALAVLSGLGLSSARAQNSPPVPGGKMYTNKQQFRPPFNLPKEDRQSCARCRCQGPTRPDVQGNHAADESQFTFRLRSTASISSTT